MKNNKVFKIIIDILSFIPLLFVLLFSLFALSSKMVFPGKYRLYSVMTGSMQPTIKTGSLILVQKQPVYKVNDIITFISANKTVTHRIKKITIKTTNNNVEGYFFTKGDNNNSMDPNPITKPLIIGKVRYFVPYLGYIISFVKTLPGLVILIVIPATIIIYSEIVNIKNQIVLLIKAKRNKQLKKEKNEKKSI